MPSEAQSLSQLLEEPQGPGIPTKVRAYICAHSHIWDESTLAGSVPQIIAGNGGSKPEDRFKDGFYGYTVVSLRQSGSVVMET